jgi:outer membrane immunogenic protein
VRYAKAPIAPLAWTWAGFYLGAHGGYGWADDPFNKTLVLNQAQVQTVFPTLSGVSSRGFVAGFHAGANWQSRSVVGGLELDISATDIKGSTSNAAGALRVTQTDKLDPVGSLRARLGYLVTPDVLVYGTGGLGWTQFSTANDYFPGFVPASLPAQSWRFGWVAGVGGEVRLGNTNWLGRIEYLHYDFGGSGSVTGTIPGFNPLPVTTAALSSGRLTADVVRAGLSYKLNWPDPAGAGGRSVIIAKAVVPAVWSWSGFYVGGHAGYGWADDRARIMVLPDIGGIGLIPTQVGGVKSSGYVAGFQAGGNWQSGQFVGGLEIDLSAAGIKGTATASGFDAFGGRLTGVLSDNIDLLGSARARLGYLVRPDILLYGTGGLAWTHLEQTLTNVTPGTTFTAVTPTWRTGWVAGAGGQMRLWNSNWIARLEYLHYDFGKSDGANQSFIDPNEPTGVGVTRLDRAGRLTTDVVRAGLDYKFD